MSVDQLLHPLPTATELLLASTIGADHLTLVGGFDTVGDGDSVLIIDTEGARHDAVARCWHDPRGLHSIVVVPVRGVRVHTIVVGTVPLTIQSPRDGLQPVLRFGAAAADAAVRNEIMAFLLSALTHGVAMTPCVSDELHLTREALRERWPSSVIDAALPPGMQIELTIAAGRTGVYLRGWIGEPSHRLARVTAVSPEGERVDLLPRLFRFPKHDVAAFYGLCGASAWACSVLRPMRESMGMVMRRMSSSWPAWSR